MITAWLFVACFSTACEGIEQQTIAGLTREQCKTLVVMRGLDPGAEKRKSREWFCLSPEGKVYAGETAFLHEDYPDKFPSVVEK